MLFPEIIGIALALSVDGFTVAVATGLSQRLAPLARSVRLALAFGGAQCLMLSVGWLAGRKLQALSGLSPWLAFVVMGWLGARMIAGAARRGETPRAVSARHRPRGPERPGEDEPRAPVAADPARGLALAALSLGTSFDGLAVGVPLGGLGASLWSLVPTTAAVVVSVTLLGALVGTRVGQLWGRRAGFAGGVALCLVGARVLLSRL